MIKKDKLDIKSLKLKGLILLHKIGVYKIVIFVIFICLIYAFVWFKISSLSNAEPSSTQVSSQVKAAAIPHIDKNVVTQLQSLQDNSVSVQALFNQARSNPFQ